MEARRRCEAERARDVVDLGEDLLATRREHDFEHAADGLQELVDFELGGALIASVSTVLRVAVKKILLVFVVFAAALKGLCHSLHKVNKVANRHE